MRLRRSSLWAWGLPQAWQLGVLVCNMVCRQTAPVARWAVVGARPYGIGFYFYQPYGIAAKSKCLLCGTLRTAFPTGHGSTIWDRAGGRCHAGGKPPAHRQAPRGTGKPPRGTGKPPGHRQAPRGTGKPPRGTGKPPGHRQAPGRRQAPGAHWCGGTIWDCTNGKCYAGGKGKVCGLC